MLLGDRVYLGMALVGNDRFSTSVKFCAAVYYAGTYLVRIGRLSGSMRNEY
jgi:hypothetical protein